MSGGPSLVCGVDLRRERVRRAQLNGLDYLEVDDGPTGGDGPVLTVYFLGKVDPEIEKSIKRDRRHVRIEGGRRIKGLQVRGVEIQSSQEPDRDDYMKVHLDRKGDFSTYVLSVVEPETGRPMTGFAPRYSRLEFAFEGDTSDVDCKPQEVSTTPQYEEPRLDYLAKDYASFRRLILDRMALIMPDWQERHVPDVGIALVELLAYIGDQLSYYQDAVATEAYLGTARQRISVRRHARLMDYELHEGCNARTWVCVETDGTTPPLRVNNIAFLATNEEAPQSNRVLTGDLSGQHYEWFEPRPEPRATLSPRDILQPSLLLQIVYPSGEEDPLDGYVASYLDTDEPTPQQQPPPEQNPEELGKVLDVLNRLIDTDDLLYGPQRVGEDVVRRAENESSLLQEAPLPIGQPSRGLETTRYLNRLAFEEAYSGAIAYSSYVYLRQEHNRIRFYTWGNRECCLPRGATSATLLDQPPPRNLQLEVGDVLIFEEVVGPKTGENVDADLTHRHAVRLTRVESGEDVSVPIVEIEWAEEDKLPFALCLSVVGPAPDCELIEDVSVARGNVILVDHGKTVKDKLLCRVPDTPTVASCEGEGLMRETLGRPEPVRPRLERGPLTFAQPLRADAPASSTLVQDPRQATGQITVTECEVTRGARREARNATWIPRRDLIDSKADRHFAIEVDNEGRAWLRFGDGELGRAPEPGTDLKATYRIGSGPTGNVGAETITHLYRRSGPVPGITRVRNPLPAGGGSAPETIEEAKLLAPEAYRDLRRAITVEDYAKLSNGPDVQRALATLGRGTEGWRQITVAVDPLGKAEADAKTLQKVEQRLFPFQRMGHEVRASKAEFVPLLIEIEVHVLPGFLRSHVRTALLAALGSLFHPDNLSFGTPVRLSSILAKARGVSGVEDLIVKKFERLDGALAGGIDTGILDIGPRQIARLDNDPDMPENGRLLLDMIGGR